MTEKNFRSSYYDKVGFRVVEEKKSLETIINEKPMDKTKLSKFCLKVSLPSIYRELVWKVLLGVISVNVETHEFTENQHWELYSDLNQTLVIMYKVHETTPMCIVHTLMYFMTDDILLFDFQSQLDTCFGRNLIALASVFLKIFPCQEVSYWLFQKFIVHQKKMNLNFKTLNEELEAILKKEDIAVYEHLKKINVIEILPVNEWFGRYFAEVLHHTSLVRIFDRIIGGSCKILPYIGSAILINTRYSLLALNSSEKVLEILEKVPEDTSEVIVIKAFDLYYS